jgi:UDPglucose 6-dehydrogenase
VTKVETACGGSASGATIAVWGLTFKANTDDRRDSPSLQIAHRLVGLGASVQAFDPTVDAEADGPDLMGLQLRADPYAAAQGARALVVLTEWDEFRWLDFSRVFAAMGEPNIVDARNLLDPAAVRQMGFHYDGIGRQ